MKKILDNILIFLFFFYSSEDTYIDDKNNLNNIPSEESNLTIYL